MCRSVSTGSLGAGADVSALLSVNGLAAGRRRGADAFLEKPLPLATLEQIVDRLVGRAA